MFFVNELIGFQERFQPVGEKQHIVSFTYLIVPWSYVNRGNSILTLWSGSFRRGNEIIEERNETACPLSGTSFDEVY